jgi:hypothetical protein
MVVEAEVRDPVSFWRFEESRGVATADIGFGGYRGTLVGSVGFVKDAERGSVLEFGGGDGYVETQAWITELGPASFSIMAWIKTREAGVAILGKSNGDRAWSFHEKQFYVSAGTEQGQPIKGGVHFYGNQAGEIWGATAVNDGAWHHVCVTWDNATKTQHIYVDGKLDDLRPVWVYYGGRGDPATDTVRLGFDCSGDAVSDFIGRMDDVAIFNVTLALPEVVRWMTLSLPVTASAPYPGNGVTDVPRRSVVVSWQPGVYAASHDVYFGTNFADVNTASRTNPLGVLLSQGQVENYYPTNATLDLDFGTTCYWRIDEVNAPPGSAILRGVVWSFTTEAVADPIPGGKISVRASSSIAGQGPENTIDSSGLTDGLHSDVLTTMWLTAPGAAVPAWIEYELDRVYKLAEMWVWNHNGSFERSLGLGCKNVQVEYSVNGVDFTALGAAPEFARAPGKTGYAHDTTVNFGGVAAKYVRLTIKSNWGGILKQYGLSEVRFFSVPVYAREPAPTSGATDVAADTRLSWRAGREAGQHALYLSTDRQAVVNGTAPVVTLTAANHTPALNLATTYYWRVDEVNDATTPSAWPGEVWSFSTQEYVVVENFESYTDQAGEEIFWAWMDGYTDKSSGSTVGYVNAANGTFGETKIVHGGRQSMPLQYDNTKFSASETTRTFAPAQNWTSGGVKSLSLWFQGVPGNGGRLYVKINGAKVFYDGDAADLARAVWQPWNIDLSKVGNVSSVRTLTLGIEGAGAQGTLYVDDLRLYPKTPEYITPAQPGATGLLLKYLFDQGSGTTVTDASGQGNTGTINGAPRWVPGVSGTALEFNGTANYVSTGKSLLSNLPAFTLGCWLKGDLSSAGRSGLIGQNDCVEFGVVSGNTLQIWTAGGGSVNLSWPYSATDPWHHVAAVADGARLVFYLDGQPAASGDVAATRYGTSAFPLNIGGGVFDATGNYFKGQMDEVQVYQRALSAAEMAGLAGRTAPMPKPF